MRCLVTGGAGFIGSHVVDQLHERGDDVLILDRHRHNQTDHVMLGDIRDSTAVTEAVAHADAVIHLAGVLGTAETVRNPRPAAETNVLGGLNVLEAVAQYDVPLVYIAVGNHWMDNTYSITKTTVERFCRMYSAERGVSVNIVRVLNAYGPRQVPVAPWGTSKVRKITPNFACRALEGMPIEVYGDGEQVMDMVYVRDAARVLVEALERPYGNTYEAGTGRRTTVNEIAETVIKSVGHGEIRYLPMRPGEPEHAVVLADPTTLAPLRLNASAFVSLEDGIDKTVDWYRGLV